MNINFDKSKLEIVKIESIRPNSWNPKIKSTIEYDKIKKGISINGQMMPIVVRNNNGYEIIDGEQRWRACNELGFTEVLIYNEGEVTDKKAKELTIWYQQQVPFDENELSCLLKELYQYPDIELPYTDDEIHNFLELEEFDLSNQDNGSMSYEEDVKTLQIKMPESQYKIIKEAIDSVKKATKNDSDGRALELICIEFINSPNGTTGLENE